MKIKKNIWTVEARGVFADRWRYDTLRRPRAFSSATPYIHFPLSTGFAGSSLDELGNMEAAKCFQTRQT